MTAVALGLAVPAAAQTVDPYDAAEALLNFGEAQFPQYFPSRRWTQSLPPYLYRYYPETGIYLGVADGKVYVLGGEFGMQSPTFVGALADFIQPLAGPSVAARLAAASGTARSTTNACSELGTGFYWEVGDANGKLAGETISRSGTGPSPSSVMSVASASKWLYGAYVAERRGGQLTAEDIKFLTFRSGYMNFALPLCQRDDTVGSCLTHSTNGVYSPEFDGLFYYDSGHMQQHAARASGGGVGTLGASALGAEISARLGPGVDISYQQPQLAGGAWTSPADYAVFLRKILKRQLKIADLLGSSAVCTNPKTCPTLAAHAPIPADETWSYSIGHWVESDSIEGDGSYSSLGTFGFYPWIDSSMRFYGILARSEVGGGSASASCGRLIRRAWVRAQAQ